ncbi:MAG: hypothetical protein RMM58_11150 [Chloroflexota bacterium]|nr:discoidin domain-containing protein [Dehalococcoidia bacterium]MDW8254420.1 hypothetical protein [Chloroflexota bacterium]
MGRTLVLIGGIILLIGCSCSSLGAAGYYVANQHMVDSLLQSLPPPTPEPTRPLPSNVSRTPTATPSPLPSPTMPAGANRSADAQRGVFREQWAIAATASSEFASPQFSALQATGPPNTPRCGDFETAWASAKKNPIEWLEVRFAVPVRATGVVIYQTFKPGRVVQVDLREPNGTLHTVFKGKDPTTTCPGQFAPQFPPTSFLVNAVRIYVEEPPEPDAYAEIDAVQLLGYEPT